jgi:hypothetical protein
MKISLMASATLKKVSTESIKTVETAPAPAPAPDIDADVDAAIAFVRQLAADAAKASAALVRHERNRSWVNHGNLTRPDQPGASWGFAASNDRASDDPKLLATLRTLQMLCGEFSAGVRAVRAS